MQKILIGTTILMVSLFYADKASADFKQDILTCFALKNNSDRLDCYDSAIKYNQLTPAQTAKTASPATTSATMNRRAVTKTTPLDTTEELVNTTPKSDTLSKKAPVANSFGQVKIEQELESIQSRLIGTFTQWKKGMKLKLENGQIWKVTSNRSGYKKMINPMVTISRGIFNSFNAKVDGLNASVKVKRIK